MRFCAVLLILLAIAAYAGCRGRSALPPEETSKPDVSQDVQIDPQVILDRMVAAYKAALSYSDRATTRIIGKMSQPDTEPTPWNCIVAFMRSNKLRLEINEGILVSDGEDCYAQIRLLPDQVLHFPAPANWTLETLFQDVHLDFAMALGLPRSVLRFPPQLVLLFAGDPLNTFIPRGAKPEWIAQQSIGEIPCDVIRISHTDGNRVLWISQKNAALLRMDYQPVGLPVPEGFESVEAIRIEMTDAQFDCNFVSETFQMLQSQDAVHVAAFHSDIPGLPALEEHRRRLQLMEESDSYRLIDQHVESATPSGQPSPPKAAPRTFTLSQMWSLPLIGVNTMDYFPTEPRKLLIPFAGNVVAILDLQGNELQRISPNGLEDSIIMDIRSNFSSENRKIGIRTLDNTFYLFGDTFKPLALADDESGKNKMEEAQCFRFVQHYAEELLVLAKNGVVRTFDSRGILRWEYPLEGVPYLVSSAVIEDQLRVLVSYTASEDSILMFSPEGLALEPVAIPFGRHALWFQAVDSTIFTLLENTDSGDVRFVGFDMTGKSQWSRLLPPGEYEVPPVFVPGERKWLVPTPSGEIWVFDQIGNVIDKFSLNLVPTGLLCLEIDGETMLLVADGETVSAWKMGKAPHAP